MNIKSITVDFDLESMQEVQPKAVIKVYRGTEKGHYYLDHSNNKVPNFVIGFRNLSEDISTSAPENGVEARIRVIPENNTFTTPQLNFLSSLGLTVKNHNGYNHMSIVCTDVKDRMKLIICGLPKVIN